MIYENNDRISSHFGVGLKKNSRGMSHFQPIRAKLSWNVDIFDQWKLDFTPITYGCSLVFLSPPGDYFTFNQPNIKYLYVICCFYTLGLADSKKFHHVCKFIFAIIFAIMLTCNFFARNQQKHHLAVESWSFKEAATFGSRSTEEFCATRGILRAPFCTFLWRP